MIKIKIYGSKVPKIKNEKYFKSLAYGIFIQLFPPSYICRHFACLLQFRKNNRMTASGHRGRPCTTISKMSIPRL